MWVSDDFGSGEVPALLLLLGMKFFPATPASIMSALTSSGWDAWSILHNPPDDNSLHMVSSVHWCASDKLITLFAVLRNCQGACKYTKLNMSLPRPQSWSPYLLTTLLSLSLLLRFLSSAFSLGSFTGDVSPFPSTDFTLPSFDTVPSFVLTSAVQVSTLFAGAGAIFKGIGVSSCLGNATFGFAG